MGLVIILYIENHSKLLAFIIRYVILTLPATLSFMIRAPIFRKITFHIFIILFLFTYFPSVPACGQEILHLPDSSLKPLYQTGFSEVDALEQ